MTTYVVTLERDENRWWVASVEGVAGCRTQGRSIRQALSRVREALGVCVDEPDEFALQPRVQLPAEARRAVSRYKHAHERVRDEQAALRAATDEAVALLISDLNLSSRDAGDLLGLSHQRIHQLSTKERDPR